MASNQKKMNLSNEQIALLNEAFDLFDMDKQGKIDLHELKLTLKAFGFKSDKEEMGKIRNMIEVEDNKITRDIFINFMTQKFNERNPIDEAKLAFDLFDTNKDDKINLADLTAASKQIGEGLKQNELQEIINEFSNDGENITKENFLKTMEEYYFD